MENKAGKIIVKGKQVDDQTRCVHYHSELDVIAIKFKCCGQYYPCYYCHQEEAGHAAIVWEKPEFNNKAILCGVCWQEMSITEYKACDAQCPFCNAGFNPKCVNHDHLYFG
ncbi:MAG: CHY zinc finger protein [Ferruginibacter sp.]